MSAELHCNQDTGYINAHGVRHVVPPFIRKLLRRFPVHAVHVVYTDIAHITDVCQNVLAHELVVPVQLVFDEVGWNHARVMSSGSHLRLSNMRAPRYFLDECLVPLQRTASRDLETG